MMMDTFQIAQNQKNLEYYSYVREIMQSKQMSYWMGNPSVQIISGTVFLKQGDSLQTSEQLDSYEAYLKQYRNVSINQALEKKISKTLVLVGIPNSKTPIQVCQRFGAYLDWIQEMRVVKTNCFKYYAILMLLKNQERAYEFYRQVMGDQYNGLEIERILLREMVQISYTRTETTKVCDNEQLFQHRKKSSIGGEDLLQKISAEQIFISSSKIRQNMNFLNPQSPKKKDIFIKNLDTQENKSNDCNTCAICFQDTENTLISILCCHYFHFNCLSQWKESICPLCRYHQHPPLIKFCEKCNQCQGLWVCLICGVRLCCGLDHNILGSDSHIYEHYLQTYHRLSMDVQTKFIFDASQLSFLHQMFYKEVLKNDNHSAVQLEQNNKKGKKTKLSQKISQYQQNISEEMQKQRAYFEENINKQVKTRKETIKEKKKLLADLEIEVKQLDKQLQQADQKNKQFETGIAKMQKQLKVIGDVQSFWKMNIQTKSKQSKQKQQEDKLMIKKLEIIIAQKKEQLKDLRKNLELSAKLKENLGEDTVEKTAILQLGNKNAKKKKK